MRARRHSNNRLISLFRSDCGSGIIQTGHSRYSDSDLLSVPAIRKDGSTISVEFTITPIKDESGKLIGMAAVMRDVTKQFQEMRALKRRLDER
jgi:PAS domain-containing protein